MRKMVLAVIFAASVSPAFAASDLVVDSTKADMFYNNTVMSLIIPGYMVPSGTDYILNSTSSKFSGALDLSPQWTGASMPTGSTPVGTLRYNGAYPTLYEYGYSPQCVAFTKAMTNTGATGTDSWVHGIASVANMTSVAQLQNKAIATFFATGGKYQGHTAILLNPVFSSTGKLVSADVVDENWQLDGRIRKHKLLVGTGTLNTTNVADLRNYYVVQK